MQEMPMLKSKPRGPLQGRRILVVEDDYVTAYDLKAELESTGAEVIGPAADIEGAMDLLASGPVPDGAVLDVNLGGEPVFPLADALRERSIRMVFTTGYDEDVLPAPYAGLPCFEKPVDMRRVAQALVD
jgi:CheY-like chemotaxis protein